MMPRSPDRKRHSTTVRLPADLLDRLDSVAEDRVIGRGKLIELLIRRGLDQLAEVTEATP